jgi:hypothetical protein
LIFAAHDVHISETALRHHRSGSICFVLANIAHNKPGIIIIIIIIVIRLLLLGRYEALLQSRRKQQHQQERASSTVGFVSG